MGKLNLRLDEVEKELQRSIKILRTETPSHLIYSWGAIHKLESILNAVINSDGASKKYDGSR